MPRGSPLNEKKIRRAKLPTLLKWAEENNILVTEEMRADVRALRELLIGELIQGNDEGSDGVLSVGPELTFEQQLQLKQLQWQQELELKKQETEVELARLRREEKEKERERERDREEREREREEREREERERQRQHESDEKEKERAFLRERMEFEKYQRERAASEVSEGEEFRVGDCYRFVPQFEEQEVERFFSQFEHVAGKFKWPKSNWCLILQSHWKGKAASAYCALEGEDRDDYDRVKEAIRLAYQLTGEAYRQKFRDMRKEGSETYCDFSARAAKAFDAWVKAEKANTSYETLLELMLLEEFKNKVSPTVRMHLEDQTVTSVREAAELIRTSTC